MLHPYPNQLEALQKGSQSRHKKLSKVLKLSFLLAVVCVGVAVHTFDQIVDNFSIYQRSLCSATSGALRSSLVSRSLCSVETVLETESFEESFGSGETTYEADYETEQPHDSVAFVVTIPSCPEDSEGALQHDDPGAAFYDAAAVLHHSVCNCTAINPESGSNYNATIYAIIHPDAINCAGPSSVDETGGRRLSSYTYDRVAVLQELGFWVIIYREPVAFSDIPDGDLKTQIETETNIRDLMRLYAYNLTRHPVAVTMNFDTVLLQPMDTIFDQLLADPSTHSLYSTKDDGVVNAGTLFVKPNETEFADIIDTFQNAVYDVSSGWNGSGVLDATAEGVLTYYYHQHDSENIESNYSQLLLSFASNPACEKPWLCHYELSWTYDSFIECREMNYAWYLYRHEFEELWSKTDTLNTTLNDFHTDFFLGYCDDIGEDGYIIASHLNSSTPAPISLAPVSSAPVTPTTPTTPHPTIDLPSYAINNLPIWESIGDSYTVEDSTRSCFEQEERTGITVSTEGGVDFFSVTPDKWVSGGLKLGCIRKDSSWNCDRSCYPFTGHHPDWTDTRYLTMWARVEGDLTESCRPAIHLTGGGWPRHSSNVIVLEDSYVDAGYLTADEWSRVVIPLEDFKTPEWNLNFMYAIYFDSCGTDHHLAQPTYHIASVAVTDTLIDLVSVPPSMTPSTSPPTGKASENPSGIPSAAYWSIWASAQDGYTIEDPNETCYLQKDRLNIVSSIYDDVEFFTVTPDPWVSGGLLLGCRGKDENWQCNRSCFPFDGTNPDWSQELYLTFLARLEGNGCRPGMSLSGGGWPRHGSNTIYLEEGYVDAGYLVSDEWRRVFIPLEDFRTDEWNLNNVWSMSFHSCGTDSVGGQNTYHIASVAVTDNVVELLSVPPSSSPSVYATDDPLLATHRMVHHHWWPIFGAERELGDKFWAVAENNSWPSVPSTTSDQTATIHIPQGQTVVYSGSDTVAYDKIVVEGSLTIQPIDADVSLTVSTMVVEAGGELNILTEENSPHTINIDFDGALDLSIDPEQVMMGILALNGNLTIRGNEIPTKWIDISQDALADSNTIVANGANLGFDVGGEIILPDTQTGLNVRHYLFPSNSDYVDQTEKCTIASITDNGVSSTISCQTTLAYNHSIGCNLAYMTRSIHLKTVESSTDRAHILHTGGGKFEVRNARVDNFGRTNTSFIDSTVMSPTDLKFGTQETQHLIKQLNVTKLGTNQIARYAIHAHHSRVECYFTGNAVYQSPRDGMVAHDSRVYIEDNIIVGADGTGIFLEDGTETGPVLNNYIIGTGGGSRGGDDGRFAIQKGKDMAHGGFGIWARGKLALVQGNHAEGHFGFAAFSFFVHPNFISDKVVPDVPGTPSVLVGKKLKNVPGEADGTGIHLQTYGGFINNTAVASFKVGIDMSYFGTNMEDTVGTIIQGARIRNLASSGFGLKTTHSRIFTLNDVVIEGTVLDNTIVGIWCNNLNCGPNCTLQTPNTTLVINEVDVVRGGNC